MLVTTLKKIKKHKPCEDGWKKLLKGLGDEYDREAPLPLERILEISGIDDALWVLRAVEGHDNAIRLYVCYCEKYCLDIFEREYPDDKSLRQAIETTERFAHGKATKEELDTARNVARDIFAVARDVARDAGGAVAWAVVGALVGIVGWYAAWGTAGALAWDAAAEAAIWALAGALAGIVGWHATRDAAWDAARDDFRKEFIRLCRLEGNYGEVKG